MSDYKRLFSYLYYYQQELREQNSGFAKIEIKNGQCRARLWVRGIFLNRAPRWNIYGFRRTDRGLKLWPLGRLAVGNGQGEWNSQMPAERFLGEAAGLGEVAGLMVCSAARDEAGIPKLRPEEGYPVICATVWDDLPLFMPKEMLRAAQIQENLEKGMPEEAGKETERIGQKTDAGQEKQQKTGGEEQGRAEDGGEPADRRTEGGGGQEAGEEKRAAVWPARTDRQEEKRTEKGADAAAAGSQTEQEREREWRELRELLEEKEAETVLASAGPEESLRREYGKRDGEAGSRRRESGKMPDSIWEGLACQYPKMVLTGMGNDWEILKIKPRDIGRLPRENWIYGNNSFLLHGYYRHHHLILACYKGAEPYQYYLGVPGSSRDRERVMASMFGFTNFLPAGKEGYWYTPVNLGNTERDRDS